MDGKSVAHDSAQLHVTGAANYVDDLCATYHPLYVALGFSRIASGEIASIDLQAVRDAQGVVDVITAVDVPGEIDIGAVFAGDPLLAKKKIEFHGQPVFAVLANTELLARRAALLASIDYRSTTPVITLKQALETGDRVRPDYTLARGEAQLQLASASKQLRGEFSVAGQEHFYLEGQVALAVPGEQSTITVHSSNQNPTEAQKLVASVLGLEMNAVVIETRRMGGGFGGKETQATACCCLAAIFANRQHRAVVCRLPRADDMRSTGKRHDFLNSYHAAYSEQGDIAAVEFQLAARCGNSPDLSDAIVDRAMFHCDNAYFLPHMQVHGLRCKTNTVSNTAFRGFGGPQGVIAIESLMDEVAFHTNLDPLDVRKRNFYRYGHDVTHYGQQVEGFAIQQIVEQLEQESDYRRRRSAIREFNQTSVFMKRGIAFTPVKFGISFTATFLNQGGALLQLYTDGSLLLNHGGTEMGQGLFVKLAQIVSTELGIPIDRVRHTATRTDKVPNTSPTAASSGTDINGMAALYAAREIKQRLIAYICERYRCEEGAVVFCANGVSIQAAANSARLSWTELATAAWMARVSLSATGFYRTPKIHFDRDSGQGRPFYYYAGGAAVSEVEIDTLSGESRVRRVDIVHDVGRSINPAIDIGQIEGGYIQGLGWLTTEELVWSDAGELLSNGPATYKIPAIGDTPATFNVSLLRNSPNDEATVFRSKAVGEPPLMLAISAWCAIRDAIAAAGNYQVLPTLNAPATPEEILRRVYEVSGKPSW